MSILDEVAPHSIFHVALDFKDEYNRHWQCIQLLGPSPEGVWGDWKTRKSIFSVTLIDGELDPEGQFLYTEPLKDHIDYFVDLCKRFASIRS